MTKRRIIKWIAGLGGLFIVMLFVLALLLPRILDSQTVRETIQAFLLSKTNGNVAFGNIDLTWLPKPAVIVRGGACAYEVMTPSFGVSLVLMMAAPFMS